MAVTGDILRSYRTPRAVVANLLGHGEREDRAFAYLIMGCLLILIAQLPRLSREAYVTRVDQTAQEATQLADQGWSVMHRLIAYEALSWMIVWPLLFYFIAFLLHGVRRLLGQNVGPYPTRLALFWAVLASSPLALLYGLVVGFLGVGAQSMVVGAAWLAAFVIITAQGLRACRIETS